MPFKKPFDEHVFNKQSNMRQWYLKNMDRLNGATKEYHTRYHKNWVENSKGELVWMLAETLVKDKILPSLGFKDIINPNKAFCYDFLARKGKRIYAIEVTTTKDRSIRPYQINLARYLKLKLWYIHVKLDLTKYCIIDIPLDGSLTHSCVHVKLLKEVPN